MALKHTPIMSVEEYFELGKNNPDARYEYLDVTDAYEDVSFAEEENDPYSGK